MISRDCVPADRLYKPTAASKLSGPCSLEKSIIHLHFTITWFFGLDSHNTLPHSLLIIILPSLYHVLSFEVCQN